MRGTSGVGWGISHTTAFRGTLSDGNGASIRVPFETQDNGLLVPQNQPSPFVALLGRTIAYGLRVSPSREKDMQNEAGIAIGIKRT